MCLPHPPFPCLFIGPSDNRRHKEGKGEGQLPGLVTLLFISKSPAYYGMPLRKAETRKSHEYMKLHHAVVSHMDLGPILWGIYLWEGVLGGWPWLLEVGDMVGERETTEHSYGDVFGRLKVQGTHPGTWVALTSTTGVGRRVRVGIAAPEGE